MTLPHTEPNNFNKLNGATSSDASYHFVTTAGKGDTFLSKHSNSASLSDGYVVAFILLCTPHRVNVVNYSGAPSERAFITPHYSE